MMSNPPEQNTPQAGRPVQLALAPRPHRNQQLFSDYYLDSLLPRREDWQMLAAEAAPVMQALAGIWAAYMPSENEAQTEDGLVKPVLARLGHTFEVQAPLEAPDGVKRPDYVFYRDQEALNANKGWKLNERLLQGRAFAVGDAKHWDRPLDVSLKSAGGDPFSNKNPSYQIFFYMQHSGLEWGILTNGRFWRLYHKDTAHKLDRFYEVDLPALLAAGDVNEFLYFYAFFRRAAFEPGPLGVAEMLRSSSDYARAVGDSLKSQVYDALRHVAQGLLDYPPNHLQPDAQTLNAIYDNALIVLYRLLFILYAEARELLPVREHAGYRDSYSLETIKKNVQQDLDAQKLILPTTATLWPRLHTLFSIINEGSPPLHVATFNGGLFDPARHPFLQDHAVGDFHLQQAIDRLARVDGQFVDYRDLAERHLGTIYEGLLEFHLEPIDAGKDAGGTSGASLPVALASSRRPNAGKDASATSTDDLWTIDLKNEKGERKATGSYYTPDYIVKYMVEETLGPLLRRAVAQASSDAQRVEAVLALKVLDPAMGSGHFPVEAMEYIARFLVETLEQPQTDAGGEAELAYWKRRVAQACIYGVDVNPLAVDLAKLSLWLATVAKNRPLSFLDHHLRCGNSLVGARLDELRSPAAAAPKKAGKKAAPEAPSGQLALFDEESLRQTITTAVDLMWLIQSSPALTVAQVKEQEQTYGALRQQLMERYGALANLVTATRFGLEILPASWPALAQFVSVDREGFALPQFTTWIAEASQRARALGFFHWELEFPEVFFDRLGQHKGQAAGFDAVLGNPPYVRQEGLSLLKPYFAAAYPATYHGVADLYVYFYEQALRLTRAGGRMAYIVTNKWMRAGYGEPLRAFFAQQGALERVIDFGHAPIFEDADVFPCILILEKPVPDWGRLGQVIEAVMGMMAPIGQRFIEAATQVLRTEPPEEHTQKIAEASKEIMNEERPVLRQNLAELGLVPPASGVGSGPLVPPASLPASGAALVPPASLPASGAALVAPASSRPGGGVGGERQVQVLRFPREELGRVNLARYIAEHSASLPISRFGRDAWNLESSAVDDLLAKIRRVGVPLAEFAGVKPFYGIKTGLNEAFLIDTPTRDQLVRTDPRSAEIIKPYLRGQDIKRWSPEWAGLWMIVLKSSGDHAWPWSSAADEATAEALFQQTYPALHEHMKDLEEKLRQRQDHGRFWWELRSCAYYDAFEQPKIIHTDITWRPQFALSNTSTYLVNTAYMWPTTDLYILAVMNSPLLWAYMWRNATHGKDEALRLIYSFVETIPIAPPTEAIRAEAEPLAARLIEIARANDEARRLTLGWLRGQFAVETPGGALEDFAALDLQAFQDEVRKRRARGAKPLTPNALRALEAGYQEQAGPQRSRLSEAAGLERRLADLVNAAYMLTPEEVALLWQTAPPRMPVGPGRAG